MAIEATSTPPQHDDEQALVVSARSDDRALVKLYELHLPRIYEFFARRIEDREAAENLTAATFQRAFNAVRTQEVDAPLSRFLYRVAGSAVVDHARRRRKPIPRGERAADHDGPGDREAAEAIANEVATRCFAAAIEDSRLRRAFTRLADEDRNLIVLRYFDGLEIDDLCALTGHSRQALTVNLHRAMRALRSTLDPQSGDGVEASDAA